ncbi:O-antigen ligase family protein [bacterium]|nr:O-antigen ligase family protein [bacterium]
MAQLVSAAMLMVALVLAPVIGGGFGELTNTILQILVLGGVIIHLLVPRHDGGKWARIPGLIPLAAFFFIVLLSAFFTESIYPTLNQVLFIAACLGAYALAASLGKDSRTAAAMVTGAVLSALAICVISIRQYAISTGGGAKFWEALLSTGEHMRLFGSFVNPGFFAGFLVLILPLTLGVYMVTRRTLLAVLVGMAFVTEILALMLTGTKFGIVAGVVALLVFFMLAIVTRSMRRSRFTRLLALAVVLLPLMILFSGPVRSRITAAETGGTQVHSTVFRVYTWRATADMIKHNLWLGVGPGVYSTAYPRYTIAGPTKYAHQSYLQVAAESGVFALGALLLGLVALAWRSLRAIWKGQVEVADRPSKSSENQSNISWTDFVPFSGWRLVNCAIFGSLTGSAVRSLVDSDWYVIGIALPFWALAGVLMAQSGAASENINISKRARNGIAAVCGVLVLLGLSFGLGDLLAPDDIHPNGSTEEILASYQLASQISPLNPDYHRKMAGYLSATDTDSHAGVSEINKAIRLDPANAANYQTRALMAVHWGDFKTAVKYFLLAHKYNPNNTQTLYQLALAQQSMGNEKGYESTLHKLLNIENSEYEQIKGAPEMVDTTFARAHAYFGSKDLAKKDYQGAISEFAAVVERLERWRSNKQILAVSKFSGMLSSEEETELIQLLRDSYSSLSQAYTTTGNKRCADEYEKKAEKVDVD